MRKNTLLLIFLLMGFCVNAQWTRTNGPEGITRLYFLKQVGTQIWAGTISGLYVSDNNGYNWNARPEFAFMSVYDADVHGDTIVVLHSDANPPITITTPGMLYTSTSFDNGFSFLSPSYITQDLDYQAATLRHVGQFLLASVSFSEFYYSDDDGQSWQVLSLPAIDNIGTYAFDEGMFLVGYDNQYNFQYFYKSAMTSPWTPIGPLSPDRFLQNVLLNDNRVLGTRIHSIVLSQDYGLSWDTVYTDTSTYFQLSPANDSIYAMNNMGDIILSSGDFGSTWQPSSGPNNLTIPNFYNSIELSNGDKLGMLNGKGPYRYNASNDSLIPSYSGLVGGLLTAFTYANNKLFAGTTSGLYVSSDGGNSWSLSGSEFEYVKDIGVKGDTLVMLAENVNYGLSFFNSFNGGTTWDSVYTFNYNSIDAPNIEVMGSRVYAATDSVYFSDDWGATWFNTNLTFNSVFAQDPSGVLVQFNNYLYITTNDGLISRFDATTGIWDSIAEFWSPGAHNGNTWNKPNGVLVMNGRDELMTSTDGVNFNYAALNGLPLDQFSDPYIPSSIIDLGSIWIGTINNSIYSTADSGNNWTLFEQNLPMLPRGLKYANGMLYTGSYYNGIWKNSIEVGIISGTVYNDENNNGIQDGAEAGMVGISVFNTSTGWATTTDSAGHYQLTVNLPADTLRPMVPAEYMQSNPPFYQVSASGSAYDFGLYLPQNIQNLTADITNVTPFRPGFNTPVFVTVRNMGSVNLPATVIVTLDTALVEYVSAVQTPNNLAGNTISWNTGTLQFLETATFEFTVLTKQTTMLGDTVVVSAIANPVIGDTLPDNNYDEVRSAAVGSYDPNDKQCADGVFITPEQAANGEELEYTVRFQNTGTFQADFVKIADTLSNYLDVSTFRLLSASHNVRYELSTGNAVNFYFDNINLPAEIDDEPGSHGFVKYTIKVKRGVTLGNSIINTAFIYFDFNPAIVTNTTTTVVSYPFLLSVPSTVVQQSNIVVKVYPNPVNAQFTVELNNQPDTETYSLNLYDLTGRFLLTKLLTGNNTNIDAYDLPYGMFIGAVFNSSNQKVATFRLIKQ